MSKAFDDLIHSLDEDDMSVLKGFILGTVREAYPDPREAAEVDPSALQVQVTGTLEGLRAFARVMAEEQG